MTKLASCQDVWLQIMSLRFCRLSLMALCEESDSMSPQNKAAALYDLLPCLPPARIN